MANEVCFGLIGLKNVFQVDKIEDLTYAKKAGFDII